jgi:hypothetical protein
MLVGAQTDLVMNDLQIDDDARTIWAGSPVNPRAVGRTPMLHPTRQPHIGANRGPGTSDQLPPELRSFHPGRSDDPWPS